MAYSAHNEFLLAWNDRKEIFVLRLNHNGRPKYYDQNFKLMIMPIATTNTVSPMAMTYSSVYDQFLFVFSDRGSVASTGLDLYALVLDGLTGVPQSGPFLLGNPSGASADASPGDYTPPQGNQTSPSAAYNPDQDEYLVVWADDRRGQAKQWDLYGQRFHGADKKPIGTPFPITTGPGNKMSPSLNYNPREGMYLLVWSDDRDAVNAGWNIYAMRLWGTNGEPRGDDYAIVETPGNQTSPALAYNATDGYHFVGWTDDSGGGGQRHINGMRLNGNGRPFRAPVMISARHNNQMFATVGGTADDGFVTIWNDDRNMSAGLDIFGRRLNGNGIPFAQDYLILTDYGFVRVSTWQ
jgi:hypothetical protein